MTYLTNFWSIFSPFQAIWSNFSLFKFFSKGGGVYKTWFCQTMILIHDAHKMMVQKTLKKSLKNCQNPIGGETNMFLTKVSDLVQNRLCLNNLKFCTDYKNIYINIIWCHWMTSDARRSHVISYNVKKYIDIYFFGIKPILNWILTIIEW